MHKYIAVERRLNGDHRFLRLFDGHQIRRVCRRRRRRRRFNISLQPAFAAILGGQGAATATVASVMVAPSELLVVLATPL